MVNIYQTYSDEPISKVKDILVFASHLLLCLFGVFYFIESLYGLDPRMIPMARFGSAFVAIFAAFSSGKAKIRISKYHFFGFL